MIIDQVLKVKIPSFQVTEFPSMEDPYHMFKIATIKSDIFAFVDSIGTLELNKSNFTSVEIYSDKTKTWKQRYINLRNDIFTAFARLLISCL